MVNIFEFNVIVLSINMVNGIVLIVIVLCCYPMGYSECHCAVCRHVESHGANLSSKCRLIIKVIKSE
jgi:hypothetical protein